MFKKSIFRNDLGGALGESLKSVLPIFAIVLVLSISLVPMQPGILVLFLFGTIMLIVGMSLFTNKVLLITGGTGGIGKALVSVFAEAGYRVSFTYHKSVESASEISGG